MPLSNAERQKRWRERQAQCEQKLASLPPDTCNPIELRPALEDQTPLQRALYNADDALFLLGQAQSRGERQKYLKTARREIERALRT